MATFIKNDKGLFIPNKTQTPTDRDNYGTDMRAIEVWANSLNIPAAFVSKLIAGTNITLTPTTGTGDVTVNASGGGGGAVAIGYNTAFVTFDGSHFFTYSGRTRHPTIGSPTMSITSSNTNRLRVTPPTPVTGVQPLVMVWANFHFAVLIGTTSTPIGSYIYERMVGQNGTQEAGFMLTWSGASLFGRVTGIRIANSAVSANGSNIFVYKPTADNFSTPYANITGPATGVCKVTAISVS